MLSRASPTLIMSQAQGLSAHSPSALVMDVWSGGGGPLARMFPTEAKSGLSGCSAVHGAPVTTFALAQGTHQKACVFTEFSGVKGAQLCIQRGLLTGVDMQARSMDGHFEATTKMPVCNGLQRRHFKPPSFSSRSTFHLPLHNVQHLALAALALWPVESREAEQADVWNC